MSHPTRLHIAGSYAAALALAFVAIARPAAADERDAALMADTVRRLHRLGYVAAPVFASSHGVPGTLSVAVTDGTNPYERARVTVEDAVLWGLLGWGWNHTEPVRNNTVFVNVGDRGTPVFVDRIRLAKGQLALFSDRGLRRFDEELVILERSAKMESSGGTIPRPLTIPDEVSPLLSKFDLPPDLASWESPRRFLLAVEAPSVDPDGLRLGAFSLCQSPRILTRCCGVFVPSSSIERVFGRTRIVRTASTIPLLGFRFADAAPTRTLRHGGPGEDDYVLLADQLLLSPGLELRREGEKLMVWGKQTIYLCAEQGYLTSVRARAPDSNPGLALADSGPLVLLFAIPADAGGRMELRYDGVTVGEVDGGFASVPFRILRNDDQSPANVHVQVPGPQGGKWPKIRGLLGSGANEITVVNRHSELIVVGVRSSDQRGCDLYVHPGSTRSRSLPDGTYEIYFRFKDDVAEVYRSESLMHLPGNTRYQLTLGTDVGNLKFRKL